MSAPYAFAAGALCGMLFVSSELANSLALFLVAITIAIACWLYDAREEITW